jgi:hypothetical protein
VANPHEVHNIESGRPCRPALFGVEKPFGVAAARCGQWFSVRGPYIATRSRCAPKRGPDRPNPVDRGKPGSKIHVAVRTKRLPLTALASAANVHDAHLLNLGKARLGQGVA